MHTKVLSAAANLVAAVSAVAGRSRVDEPAPGRHVAPPALLDTPATRRSGPRRVMIGLTPKSSFLPWLRFPHVGKGKVSEAVMKRFLTSRRQEAFHHFSRMIGGRKRKSGDMSPPDDDVRVTRSSTPEVEDWTVDTDAANCSVTDTRRLDRYSLEYIFTLPRHSSLLLLVRVSDDRALFDGKATKVDALQNVPRKTICGDQYYQLRCRLSDTFHNDLVTQGVAAGLYTESVFKTDVERGNGGFGIEFCDTPEKANLTWKAIIANPKVFMFFGPPLSCSRSFDDMFANCETFENLHHKFVCFHEHFLGDVNASLALQNAYLSKRCNILEKQLKAKEKKAAACSLDADVFRAPATVDFVKRFDKMFENAFEQVCTDFCNHSLPIVEQNKVEEFIEEAPVIYGALWKLMLELRGGGS